MKKLCSLVVIGIICIACTAMCASALGLQHVTITGGIFNTIQAGFSESQYGTGLFGTDPNRIVKQCYVRLTEGSFDSCRVYSDVGAMYGGWEYIWTDVVSKFNNPFQTCYTYYGWLYY
jgi:hypothetical protein